MNWRSVVVYLGAHVSGVLTCLVFEGDGPSFLQTRAESR